MFRTSPEPPAQPEPEAAPVADPAPATGIRPVSMFGTKEEKLARFGPPIERKNLPPRIVSFGRQVRHVPGAGRSQKARIIEVEAYVDLNDPRNTYVREPGSTAIQATMIRTGGETEVLDRFSVPRRDRNPVSGNHPAGKANQIIEPPELSDEARAMARALFARPENGAEQTVTPAFDPVEF